MVPMETAQEAPGRNLAPTRSVRRATARRASSRRASARSLRSDSETLIVGFVAGHPGSTTGDISRSLNLERDHVAICLTRLTRSADVHKVSHGYETSDPGDPAG